MTFTLKSKLSNNKVLLENFSYITIMRIIVIISPLITYPYLTRVLGTELYGNILVAQMLASYASLLIDYGSNKVCAKHVAINRDNNKKLSIILSSVLLTRLFIWIACLFFYLIIVLTIDNYRNYSLLFLLSYGYTFNELIFPQFFFQGLEKMKYSSLVNISIKFLFVLLIFVFVKNKEDYLFVPILYGLGYFLGGIISLYIINSKLKVKFSRPQLSDIKLYISDSSSIFATDVIASIKDKVNYLLIGQYVGMQNVVVYDLGLKLTALINQPLNIICTVLFPKFAINRNLKHLKKVLIITFLSSLILVSFVNIFLEDISLLFINKNIDLLPIRLFLLSPIFLSISTVLSYNYFLAFGYNKFILYSIIITTIIYLILIVIMFCTGYTNNMYTFVIIALISYFTEMLYKLYTFRNNENKKT